MNTFGGYIINGKFTLLTQEKTHSKAYFQKENVELSLYCSGFFWKALDVKSLEKEKKLRSKALAKLLQEADGDFSGCLWEKDGQILHLFTDYTASGRLFYSQIPEGLVFANTMKQLCETLLHLGFPPQLHEESCYSLVTYGFCLGKTTPFVNVYQLRPHELFSFHAKENAISIENYEPSEYQKFKGSFSDAVHEFDTQFSKAIQDFSLLPFSNNITFLSGGLDSRMTLAAQMKCGILPDFALCFSEKNYEDEVISRKIAMDWEVPYHFIPLNGGEYLNNIDRLGLLSDGTCNYYGGIHMDHALDQSIHASEDTLLWSGQLGDGVLSNFTNSPLQSLPQISKMVELPDFHNKIAVYTQKHLGQYSSHEVMMLEEMCAKKVSIGGQVAKSFGVQVSPFMHKDVLKFIQSLPEAWKYQYRFYFVWLNTCHPNAAIHPWERTGIRPKNAADIIFAEKWNRQIKMRFRTLFSKAPVNMTLYSKYWREQKMIRDTYHEYFAKEIYRLDAFPELQNDVKILFRQKDFYRKAKAIHILSVCKNFIGLS